MIDLTDGLLNAYLDDELDAITRANVARELDETPGAMLRLERMRSNDARLRDAFPITETQEHDLLAARIMSGKDFDYDRRPKMPWKSAGLAAISAIAAGVFGLMIGRATIPDEQPRPQLQTIAALDSGAIRALNANLSGATDPSTQVKVSLSFMARDGEICRQFSTPNGEGVACKMRGDWRLAAWDGAVVQASSAGYQTAGASSLIDDAVDALGAGDPLSKEQEKTLIAKSWDR